MQTIFGYSWEGIQRAQQGGMLSSVVGTSEQPIAVSKDDLLLLQEHGVLGLAESQFFGVLDRLRRSGLTQ